MVLLDQYLYAHYLWMGLLNVTIHVLASHGYLNIEKGCLYGDFHDMR